MDRAWLLIGTAILLATPSIGATTASAQSIALPAVTVDAPAKPRRPMRAARTAAPRTQTAARPAREASPPAIDRPVVASARSGFGITATTSTTGTKTDTPLLTTPQSISAVTSGQMRQQGIDTVSQGLAYTPGVHAEQRIDGLYDGVFIRGFGGFGGLADFNKFYDGLRLPSAQYLAVPSIDPYTLERVDVLKGPASVLYGGASPGGIVNMISKKPTDTAFGEVGVTFGNRNRTEGIFDVGGPVTKDGTLLYRFTGIGRSLDTQVDQPEAQQHIALAPSFTWRPDADTSLTVLLNYQNDPDNYYSSWLPALGTVLPSASGRIGRNFYSGDPSYENLSREQIAVGYEFQHRLNDAVVFRQNAKFVHVDLSARGLTVNYLDPIGATSSTVNRWASNTSESVSDINVDNQLEASFQTGALQHTTLAGVSVQAGTSDWTWRLGNASSIDTLNPVYNFNIAATTLALRSDQTVRSKQLGAYVQDQIKWGGLSLLLGGRHDWAWIDTDDRLRAAQVNQYDGAFSGRAGLSYEFSTGLTPYVSYATSFEPIIGTAADGTPYKPSEGRQTEVGIKYKPTGIDAFLTVAAFDITQTNVRTMSSVGTGYVQTGEIKSRGFEFEAHANPSSNLDLIASYAFVDATVSSDTDVSIIGNAPVSVPKHMASLWANYRFSERPVRGLSVSGGARYVGVSQGDPANSFAVPAVTLFDAALRYDFGTGNVQLKGVEGSVNVRNLFDKDYVSSCFSTGGCFYGQGRTVAAMLKYRW